MKKHGHIIGRQVFDIQFSSKEKAHHLQNRISQLFNTQISSEMGKVLDEVIPENRLIKIDKLVLDIGEITIDSLETELPRRISRKLEEELMIHLLHDNSAMSGNAETFNNDIKGNYLSLLEFFLLKGSLPWWAGGEQLISPLEAFEFLIKNASEQLHGLLLKIGSQSYVRSRIVFQFPESIVKSTIQILEPDNSEFIITYHERVVTKQTEEELVKAEGSEFSKAVWVFILTYLLVDRGSHFNRKIFVKQTLQNMASNFNLEFEELLHLFISTIRRDRPEYGNVDSLESIIFELSIEQPRPLSIRQRNLDTGENSADQARAEIELVSYFLMFQSLPAGSKDISLQDITSIFSHILQRYPENAAVLIKVVGQQDHSRRFFVKTFEEEILIKVVEILEPGQGDFVRDYVAEVKSIHTSKSLIKTQTEDLTIAVWDFIFEYLLIDRGSEFNRQVFLESNLRKLANKYNVNYAEMLVFMVRNISVFHHTSNRHVALFHGLSKLYEENRHRNPNTAEYLKPSISELDAGDFNIPEIRLGNVLYFWARFGYFPWWAEDYRNQKPDELITQFITASPEEALLFLKYTGSFESAKTRLVSQLSFTSITALLSLPLNAEYKNLFDEISQITQRIELSIRFTSASDFGSVLVLFLWDELIIHKYQSFDPERVIVRILQRLQSWAGESTSVKDMLTADIIGHGNLPKLFIELSAHVKSDNQSFQELIGSSNPPEFEKWMTEYLSSENAGKNIEIPDLIAESFEILRSFLFNGYVPAKYASQSAWSRDLLLKQVLIYLNREKPSELEVILRSESISAERFLILQEIVQRSASISEDRKLDFMKSYLSFHVIQYVKQYQVLPVNTSSFAELVDSVLRLSKPSEKEAFIKNAFKFIAVSELFARYFANEQVFELIGHRSHNFGWGLETESHLREYNIWLESTLIQQSERVNLNFHFRAYTLLMMGGNITHQSFQSFMAGFFQLLYRRDYQLLQKIVRFTSESYIETLKENQILAYHIEAIKEELRTYSAIAAQTMESHAELKKKNEDDVKKINDMKRTEDKEQAEKLARELEEQNKRAQEDSMLNEEGTIYIKNAGLVLLHPFLATYFNRLNMLEKGDFISEELRHRAVHLLQYLVFGTERNEEHELVLNKIFCNIPLGIPLALEITLTEHERTVSAELLNAVISQWDKLKNTSAESLKTSFLQREGALLRNEESWNLKVEQRGYDVLLQTLPWGLGMIKTSWMAEFIYVEWM